MKTALAALAATIALATAPARAANPSMIEGYAFDKPAFLHSIPHPEANLVVQISDDRPELWNVLLNNVQATQGFFGPGRARIVVVAYGPGLKMIMKGSPVAERIAALNAAGVEFDACKNTIDGMTRATGHAPELLDTPAIVPSGVVRIMQLQGHGFSYVRP